MKIKYEKAVDGGVRGEVQGWAAESWSGDRGIPRGYFFSIYSPQPGQVRVALQVRASNGQIRSLKPTDRNDLKNAIVQHYKDLFPNCIRVR